LEELSYFYISADNILSCLLIDLKVVKIMKFFPSVLAYLGSNIRGRRVSVEPGTMIGDLTTEQIGRLFLTSVTVETSEYSTHTGELRYKNGYVLNEEGIVDYELPPESVIKSYTSFREYLFGY